MPPCCQHFYVKALYPWVCYDTAYLLKLCNKKRLFVIQENCRVSDAFPASSSAAQDGPAKHQSKDDMTHCALLGQTEACSDLPLNRRGQQPRARYACGHLARSGASSPSLDEVPMIKALEALKPYSRNSRLRPRGSCAKTLLTITRSARRSDRGYFLRPERAKRLLSHMYWHVEGMPLDTSTAGFPCRGSRRTD